MRIFTEEYSSGTIEPLITKPITSLQIILAKFLAVLVLVLFAILPTLIYVVSIYYLGESIGNLDLAGIMGSYFGLIFLCALFSAISIFASSLANNQIISFAFAILISTLFYFGFDVLSELSIFKDFDLIIDGHYIDITYLDDGEKFWIMTRYPIEEELPRLSETEIAKKLNK